MATIEELAGCTSRRCTVRIIDETLNIPAGYKVIHRSQMTGEHIQFFYMKDLKESELPIGNHILQWIMNEVHNEELPIRRRQ